LFSQYLTPASANYLTIDPGLIEVLNYKLNDPTTIMVENTWFDSISKFVYEKLKNDEIFLSNFYQSSAYKKLLLELDVLGQQSEHDSDIDLNLVSLGSVNNETESEGSSDLLLDDDDDETDEEVLSVRVDHIKEEYGFTISRQPASEIANIPQPKHSNLMPLSPAHVQLGSAAEGVAFKHNRSHSDCTGLMQGAETFRRSPLELKPNPPPPPVVAAPMLERERASLPAVDAAQLQYKQKLSCKIINTAIHSDGNYAVYAIQVEVVEENKHKSWHIYRRYSKFLELKKYLIKRFPFLKKVPFPAKKAFANTQRAVLEHRMSLLNEFLAEICEQAERNDEMNMIMRDFLEPDTDDRKLSGGAVIRTIESLVHPFKSGMRTIKNMPDTLVGGISRILLGKGPMKEHTFLNYSSDVEVRVARGRRGGCYSIFGFIFSKIPSIRR
jgi:sorting nexin-13